MSTIGSNKSPHHKLVTVDITQHPLLQKQHQQARKRASTKAANLCWLEVDLHQAKMNPGLLNFTSSKDMVRRDLSTASDRQLPTFTDRAQSTY